MDDFEKEILGFIDSLKDEMIELVLNDKAEEIVDVFTSGEAREAAKEANKALSKAELDGVTSNPSNIIETLKIDKVAGTISVDLTEEDERLLRYDSVFGKGVFSKLDFKHNVNDANP